VGAAGLCSLLTEALEFVLPYDELIALIAVYALLTLLGEDLSDRVPTAD